MRAAVLPCEVAIKKCNAAPESSACTAAFAICNYGENIPYQLTGNNPYDMRIKCESPPLCYDFSEVAEDRLPWLLESTGLHAQFEIEKSTHCV